MTETQLMDVLNKALQNKAPDAYRQMKADGTLNAYLRNLLSTTQEAISEARQGAIDGLVTQGSPQYVEKPLARTQAINSAQKSAEEMALAQAMETIEALSPASATTTA